MTYQQKHICGKCGSPYYNENEWFWCEYCIEEERKAFEYDDIALKLTKTQKALKLALYVIAGLHKKTMTRDAK